MQDADIQPRISSELTPLQHLAQLRGFTLLSLRDVALMQIDNVERRSSQAAAQLLGELRCCL